MRTTLGEICVSTQTVDPTRQPDAEFLYVDISAVDNVWKRIIAPKTLLGADAPSRARNIIRSGDVIVATTRPNLNAVALIPPEMDGSVCSTGFCVLRPSSRVDSDFLFFTLQTPALVNSLSELARGANYPAVSDRQVFAQEIELPDLKTQRRFATRLKSQMAAVEEARRRVEEQAKAFEDLIASWIRDGIRCSETVMKPVEEVLEEVTQGIGSRWAEYPVLGATRNGAAPAKDKVGKIPGRYKPVLPGSVFYNPMRIMIGSIAMLDEGDAPGITSPDYVVVRPRGDAVHHLWAYEWLRGTHGVRFIQTLARGGVRERMLYNRLKTGEMPVPPRAWQDRFAKVGRLRRQAANRLSTQLEALEALPGAFLREAFGNLQE